jgi:outer membrane protein assembly factor BamB
VLTELDGERQIVVVNEDFVTGHRAADGRGLWEYPWSGDSNSNASASNPVPIGGNRLLLSIGYGVPTELIEVTQTDGAWSATRVWRKPTLRTKMSNVVIRDGYAYGIDDVDLACIDLSTGGRKWKSRRRPSLGNGQIMLVGKHILAISESGEAMLVAATPDTYRELASFQALESERAWNNPALAGSLLLVRDAEEAACFELPLREESDRN